MNLMLRRLIAEGRIWLGAIVWACMRGTARYVAWVRRDRARGVLGTSAVAVVLAAAMTGGGTDQTEPSASRYISWMTNDTRKDSNTARETACHLTGNGGVVLIAFGRQVDGGTRSFDGADVLYTYDHLGEVAVAYAEGLAECSDSSWTLVVATSNYRLDDPDTAARHGRSWSEMIDAIDDSAPERIRIVGGVDLEPGWGSPEAAREWVGAYKDSGLSLVSNASADGCPLTGKSGRCANGWDVPLLAELVWGGGEHYVLPQIYRHDGAQAKQWGVLSRYWAKTGGEPRFAGAMTQVRACELVRNSNCPQLSLGPEDARKQLQAAVGDDVVVPHATDIGWG